MPQIYTRIMATGSALPERVVTNADLEKIVDTTDEWIRTRTGIRQRHIAADGQTTGDLAFQAAQNALETAGVKASELDLIILGTTTPDIIFPSTACLIQHRLGANGCAARAQRQPDLLEEHLRAAPALGDHAVLQVGARGQGVDELARVAPPAAQLGRERIARVDGVAARSAGIQPGDVVLSVGRTPVGTPAALDRELGQVKAGQTVMLLVRRGAATQFIAVTPRTPGVG